jgi:hypothetical protein
MDTELLDAPFSERAAATRAWMTDVRDPADNAREGKRCIECGRACGEYDLAEIPCGWAWRAAANLGWMAAFRSGWSYRVERTRDAARGKALEMLVDTFSRWRCYREEFESDIAAILDRLDGGLFGFEEPRIEENSDELG